MRAAIKRRLAELQTQHADIEHAETVAQISELMDELSAKAVGGQSEAHPRTFGDYMDGLADA
ncbi:MAG: hypothetical protein ACTJG4_03060 [Vreelandella alkaliphila]|uniref:Uncharacterized protein n=1 Tax=Halomonas campaniensis TaxID=213554 RepID=A0A3D0KI78_9GAMM|nr:MULTISPECIES: hypothetical protein [unclassified Halomonas]HBP41917.1 hypothetical protein [Halomonas sp.]HBS82364.1 hypothetical protein [Halomonas campaniensis]HCA03267.1 hypothetical protein [Halomonas campaniensis]